MGTKSWFTFTTGVTAIALDDHHARHEDGGDDEVSLTGLSGDPADTINESLLTTQNDIIVRGASIAERLNITASKIVARLAAGNIVAATGAQILALLTGQAGATFDWNAQNLTNIGSLTTDTGTPRDLDIYCGAEKTIELQTVVYDDMQFHVSSGKVPAANFPDWETFTTNTKAYAFEVDDYIDLEANEIPHWWKEGTNGHVHIHFTIKTEQATGANRFAKFSVWVAYADTDEAWVEQAVMTAEKTIPTGSAALTNFYLDMGNATLTNYLIGAQVKARVKRIAATGGTEYADNVYITQVGIHFEKDTMGSRQEIEK